MLGAIEAGIDQAGRRRLPAHQLRLRHVDGFLTTELVDDRRDLAQKGRVRLLVGSESRLADRKQLTVIETPVEPLGFDVALLFLGGQALEVLLADSLERVIAAVYRDLGQLGLVALGRTRLSNL